jgi:hypothetical protein
MATKVIESQIVESLRKGIPPQRGVNHYAVGNEKLISGIKRFHLSGIGDRGIIRFVNGSWGAGKTHFFRLLREVAFENNCLVSNVELNVSDAALNRFERVFYSIVRNVATPSHYTDGNVTEAAPFGRVLREALLHLGGAGEGGNDATSFEVFRRASETLMANHSIDVDFKKIVQSYWQTFVAETDDIVTLEKTRDELLQWFSGEGAVASFRKRFEVNKIVSKDNARVMLQSLAAFVRLAGYEGLLILFDEAEQAYSVMRKSALKEAHNNLLSLINNIDGIPGLFLIYATTPDFFTDPQHGIVIYGALSGRIGKPEQRAPRALDNIWNFDAVDTELGDYQAAARRVRDIYAAAYPEVAGDLPGDDEINGFVARLHREHPSLSAVRFWRVLVTAVIAHFDDHAEGDVRPTEQLYDDVMDRLRED